jgi:NADP-dependent 3-hydroxy acid dehydrogenase YdfG
LNSGVQRVRREHRDSEEQGAPSVDRPLGGCSALVTGAGGDIGRAVAVVLSELGAAVGLVGRTRSSLDATAHTVVGEAEVLPTDLTCNDEVTRLVAQVKQLFADGLDVLVHCAGVYASGQIDEALVDDLDSMYDANVRAPYRLTQLLLPQLMNRQGDVVFVNSTQGIAAVAGIGQYAATQHAMKAVADSLRAEVNRHGVRVLTLHVGRTATRRMEKIFAAEGRAYRPELLLQPTDVARTIAYCLSLPRTAEVTSLTIRPAIKSD